MRHSALAPDPDNARSAGRVLLLQGPMGPFFRRFARELAANGYSVININFNGGDRFFLGGPAALDFRGSREDWPDYLAAVLRDYGIERIFLFGDCRWHHQAAKRIAEQQGIELFVFEEGYLRPNYVTLEADGVNGYSSIPRDPDSFVNESPCHAAGRGAVDRGGWSAAFYATLYSLASAWHSTRFPHYRHHRSLDIFGEGTRWILAGVRRLTYGFTEWSLRRVLLRPESAPFFLVTLQVHLDAQVVVHSRFESVEAFISEVLVSFAHHAPPATMLVFKHHPLDHAYRDYEELIHHLATHLQVRERVKYLHVGGLPPFVKRCRGLIAINSTAGLFALQNGRPVKVLGKAVYDMPGLTFQGSMNDFWSNPGTVDRDLCERFRGWLLRNAQVSGSFYRRPYKATSPTGLWWPPLISRKIGLPESR